LGYSLIRRPSCVIALVVVAVAAGVAALAAAGCSGPSGNVTIHSFVGAWQRVDGGVPNPAVTLEIVAASSGASLNFADKTSTHSLTVLGALADGTLDATLSAAEGSALGLPSLRSPAGVTPSPGAASATSGSIAIALSLDDTAPQLTLDVVGDDGTSQPVLIYQRAPVP
jgi:hypothetical protein